MTLTIDASRFYCSYSTKWTKLDSSLYTLTLAQSKSFANAATLQKKDPHPHVAPTLLKQVIVYSATNVRDFSANLLSKYGLCIYSLRKKVWGRLPPTILAWDQTISPCVGAQRQGSHALHHLADTGKSKQLQPIIGDVTLMPEGKVSHHVRPGNGHLEQEERGLQ